MGRDAPRRVATRCRRFPFGPPASPPRHGALRRGREAEELQPGRRRARRAISSLSRRITQFETAIGLRLLDRTTRKLVLTPHGEAYYAQAIRLVEEAQRTFDELIAQAKGPSGLLKIAAPPPTLGDAPPLDGRGGSTRSASPRCGCISTSGPTRRPRPGGLRPGARRRGAAGDLADHPQGGGTRERPVRRPGLLDRAGRPDDPSDLARHQAVVVGAPAASNAWPLQSATGRRRSPSVPRVQQQPDDGPALRRLGTRHRPPAGDRRRAGRGGGAPRAGAAGLVRRAEPGLHRHHLRLLPAKTRSFIAFASRHFASSWRPAASHWTTPSSPPSTICRRRDAGRPPVL